MPRLKSTDPEVLKENARKSVERKERQARQAIEGVSAMTEYRKAADDAVGRMARLREERLKRAANRK